MKRPLFFALAALAVAALVLAASGCGGSATTTTAAPGTTAGPDPTSGGAQDGAALFAATCTPCHGDHGQGGRGPDLRPLTETDKDRVIKQVTNGGTSMPSFGGTLTPEQIDAVATYVTGLE